MLGFGRPNEIDDVTMRSMAEATGGQYHHATSTEKLIGIFESISVQLHDDGIDEDTLKRIAKETRGEYHSVKDTGKLKMVLGNVTQSIRQLEYRPIVFESLIQRADGSKRDISIKLIRRVGGVETVVSEKKDGIFKPGLVVAEMNHYVFLVFLIVIGCLIALPGILWRASSALCK